MWSLNSTLPPNYLKVLQLALLSIVSFSCTDDSSIPRGPERENREYISAADISSYPEIADSNPVYFDGYGNPKDFLDILRENEVNTIRLRLWVNPEKRYSSFKEVQQFSQKLKTAGFKTWLSLHYSDTWADPGHQAVPSQWRNTDFAGLKDSLYSYTRRVMVEMRPDYIQIGNEINSGILHPHGNFSNNRQKALELLATGISAVRESSTETKIILHYAGIDNAISFFRDVQALDYDIIGLSYYPIWHGKSLEKLGAAMQELSLDQDKGIVLAETAYPFTLGWNDWTNNIVGEEHQLILPNYPASPEGQRDFIKEIKNLSTEVKNGLGFCYWGGELIAWKGSQSEEASPWENQALFDFENKALPALTEFSFEE